MKEPENFYAQTPSTSSTPSTGAGFSLHLASTKPAPAAPKRKEPAKVAEQPPGQNVVAKSIVAALSNRLTHDPVTGEWHKRTGNIFTAIQDTQARLVIRQQLEKSRANFAYAYLSGVYKFVRDDLSLFEWTSDSSLLPLENGLFDLKSGKLRKYKQSDRFSSCLPIEYNANASCPRTQAILRTIAGNSEMYDQIIAFLFVVLTRRYDLQKYFEFLGPGGTGKSTVIDLATRLVGENNRAVTDLKELENNRFESASLYKKYLIVINDSGRYCGNVAKLKAITGGDSMRNEVKNKQQAEPFIVEGIVAITANEPIQSEDLSTGLTRRRIAYYFTYVITPADKAKYPEGVSAVFDEELPGLLNLLMQQDESTMIDRIINPSASIKAGKLQAELATNPLLQWSDDFLVPADEGKETPIGGKDATPFNGLYASYCNHCENAGNEPVSLARFSNLLEQQLNSRGIQTRKHRTKQGRFMKGLALRGINDKETETLLTQHQMTD